MAPGSCAICCSLHYLASFKMNGKLFILDSTGKCSSCDGKPPDNELIKCSTCKHVFHALCPTSNDDNFICRKTFLGLFRGPSVKSNFQWHCDSCLTALEEKTVSVLEDRFDMLVHLVTDLSKEVQSLKEPTNIQVSPRSDGQTGIIPSTAGSSQSSPWSNQARLKRVKSSLVLRNKSGVINDADMSTDLQKLKALAMNNNISVSRVGHDSSGNTFVECPTETDRDRLQPQLITQDFSEKTV